MKPKLSVIVLNYNKPADTIECVESVMCSRTDSFNLEILIVDNSEGEESYSAFAARFPQLRILHNGRNLGYAGGNNAGMAYAFEQGADYALILNNDCIVEIDTLEKLMASAAKWIDTGVLAPLVLRYDDRAAVDSCGTAMDWLRLRPRSVKYKRKDDPSLPKVIEAEIIPGSALLLDKKFLERSGMFNDDYFLIHEDADLCLRSLKRNYKNRVVTDAVVYHKISGTFNAYPGLSAYYSVRNFLRLSAEHNPLFRRLTVYAGLFLLSVKKFAMSIWTAAGRRHLRWFLQGIFDYFNGVKGPSPHQEQA